MILNTVRLQGQYRKTLWWRGCMLVLVMFAAATMAKAEGLDEPAEFDIPAQGLDSALLAFSEQGKIQVVVSTDAVSGQETEGIEGEHTPREALEQILASTGLIYSSVGLETVAVSTLEEESPGKVQSTPSPRLMAQNKESRATVDQESDNTREGDQSPARIRTRDDVDADEQVSRETRGRIDNIVVVGSRNAGIRRYEDDAQPYVVFNALDVEESLAGNVEDFLRKRLPMNASQTTLSQTTGLAEGGNQSRIALRGLDANQTLILVDGRRLPSVSNGTDFFQPDVNGIPLSAIERIEVLPSTASGIYGGGATGGAINIILKRDYSGGEFSVGYDNTFDSDVSVRRFDGSLGASLEGGKTNILITASYSDANPLLVGDRDLTARARELNFQNNPDAFFSAFFPPTGFTTNIRSISGANLVLDNGTPLGSPYTFVPAGYPGLSTDGGAALVGNAGQYNLDLPDDLSGARSSLFNNPVVESASLSIRREFADNLELYLDAGYYNNEGRRQAGTGFNFGILAPDAATNPFDETIVVSFPLPGAKSPIESTTRTDRVLAGGRLDLAHNWAANFEYGWSRSASDISSFNGITNVDFFFDVGAGVVDIMRDVNEFPLDLNPYLVNAVTSSSSFENSLRNASIRLSGPTIELPGGPVIVSALLENRDEEMPAGFVDFPQRGFSIYRPELQQDVTSAYVEAIVPIASKAMSIGGMREFEVQLALRHDRYDTTSPAEAQQLDVVSKDQLPDVAFQNVELSSTNYTLGLRYKPIADVLLRASFGTGFLAPSLSQVQPLFNVDEFIFFADPKRSGVLEQTPIPIEVTSGGNPAIGPEESESLSFGVILTPGFVPGLRLSIDYTRIEKTDEIANPIDFTNFVDFEDSVPGTVTRAPLTPEDEALGYTGGAVVAIDVAALNVASSKVEAYDFQVNYEWRTAQFGEFELYAVATRQSALGSRVLSNLPEIDRVGFSDGPLEWRGNVGLNWNVASWRLGWNTQYFDSYKVYRSGADTTEIATFALNQGSASIPSQTYHDFFAQYEFAGSQQFRDSFLDGVDLRIGIQNVFDESPPIVATVAPFGGYSTYGDPRLRRYSILLRKRF